MLCNHAIDANTRLHNFLSCYDCTTHFPTPSERYWMNLRGFNYISGHEQAQGIKQREKTSNSQKGRRFVSYFVYFYLLDNGNDLSKWKLLEKSWRHRGIFSEKISLNIQKLFYASGMSEWVLNVTWQPIQIEGSTL